MAVRASDVVRAGALGLGLLLLLGGAAAAADDLPAVRFREPTLGVRHGVDQLLEQAAELERQRRWGEALRLYQQAVRDDPGNEDLRGRRIVAQIHFDLARRYRDSAFLKTVAATSGAQALATYAEVLNKINAYHAQPPDWAHVAALGGQSLEIALQQPDFVAAHVAADRAGQLAGARDDIRQMLQRFSVASGQDAYLLAESLARQLQARLGLPAAAAVYEFLYGAVLALDPYSAYMTETQYLEAMSQIEGNFVGLGVELKTLPGRLEIVRVIAQGPAGQAGLLPGDAIVAVDQSRVDAVGSEVAADLLRGAENTAVRLAIQRQGATYSVSIVRRPVEIPSISQARMIDGPAGIGYIRLASFQKTTARDFDAALRQLERAGLQRLIVDLRGNPGGLLTAAVDVADRFIASGVIVATRGRNPMENFVHRAHAESTSPVPLVLLIDGDSASAAEILAAAIADHGRGRLVGSRSYGKGSVQGIFPLGAGGGIRLTTAKFYSPAGREIQQQGVTPDVEVAQAARPAAELVDAGDASDAALRIAVEAARQIAAR